MVAGLADELRAWVEESPFAHVDGEAEPRDQWTARQVRILVVASDVGARAFDQLLHDPRRNIGAIAGIDVAEHLELGEEERPVRSDTCQQAFPIERVTRAEEEVLNVRHVVAMTFVDEQAMPDELFDRR